MAKWYEMNEVDDDIVISSRVRLARNLKNFPFAVKLNNEAAEKMISQVKEAILNDRTPLASQFKYYSVNTMNITDKQAMVERHIISPVLRDKKESCGVIVKDDETVNIMLNEEDHIRIQTVFPGENMDKAWDMADKIDNLIEESVEYAFDEDFGYLTSCPTNVGTGIRASYMVHLPALNKTKQIRNVIQAINKFGITVRGIYGEGSESKGSIFQISNQVTLGQSEQEIINNLKNVMKTVIEQEKAMKERILKEKRDDFEDEIYRSYGILKSARKISANEAMEYLSNIREGYILNIFKEPHSKMSIYNIMMNIQPGIIQSSFDSNLTIEKRDHIRAKYIREQL